jgi:hypothetical protein
MSGDGAQVAAPAATPQAYAATLASPVALVSSRAERKSDGILTVR